jgi:hypothetical protein
MAINGTKIIDSDLAHDIYGEFMDLYDANVDIGEIKQKIENWRNEVVDDIEFEIFITTYGLALWEIGHLTPELLKELIISVDKGASVEMFQEEMNEAESKKRIKKLNKLISKISQPKEKPRKRKKFKKIENFLIDVDSVVAFKLIDESYRAAILFNIDQYRGNCVYQFTPIAFSNKNRPTVDDVIIDKVFINKIGCMMDRETVKQMQSGIEKFWKMDAKFSIPFTIGLPIYGINHKDLIRFVDKFEIICQVKIGDSFKKLGSIGYESSFEDFCEKFVNVINYNVNVFKYEMIDLKEIME